jgi:hypothetical protein
VSSLPQPDEPIILADGTRIDPSSGRVVIEEPEEVEIPTHSDAVRELTAIRRRVADLPDVPERMNVVSAVLTYKLFGLSNSDITHVLPLTTEQIVAIVQTEAYRSMQASIVESIMAQDAEDIRSLLHQKARDAAQRIGHLVNSDNDAIALNAAKDVLDRDGHRAADIIEHRHKMEGGLRIEIVKKGFEPELPVIDIAAIDEG